MKVVLTDLAMKLLKPKAQLYQVADGGGLYLIVTPRNLCKTVCTGELLCGAPL